MFRPYKLIVLPQLNQENPDREIPFYEVISERFDEIPNHTNVIFCDKYTFSIVKIFYDIIQI